MSKLKTYQEQLQQSIDKSISIVEDQYKNLMTKPFQLAEKVEAQTKNISVRNLKEKHDQAVDSLSDSLRTFNKKLNEYVSEILAKLEGGAEKAVEEVQNPKTVEAISKKAANVKSKVEDKVKQTAETA